MDGIVFLLFASLFAVKNSTVFFQIQFSAPAGLLQISYYLYFLSFAFICTFIWYISHLVHSLELWNNFKWFKIIKRELSFFKDKTLKIMNQTCECQYLPKIKMVTNCMLHLIGLIKTYQNLFLLNKNFRTFIEKKD